MRTLTGLALVAFALSLMVKLEPALIESRVVIMPDLHDLRMSAVWILGFQAFWVVLEFSFERLAISRIWEFGVRGSLILCLVIVFFVVDKREDLQDTVSYDMSLYGMPVGLCLAICSCGVWVVIWPAINLLAGRI